MRLKSSCGGPSSHCSRSVTSSPSSGTSSVESRGSVSGCAKPGHDPNRTQTARVSNRSHLPQLDGGLFLTDGGIETTLIFHEGLDLPEFAAFDLLRDDAGTAALRRYFEPYAALARDRGAGFVLESPTWRANPRWAERLGYSPEELDALNRRAIALMDEIRRRVRGRLRADRHQRLHRPAGRRLRPVRDPQRRRGAGVPLGPDRDLRGHRRGHGHRDHDDLRGRGDRASRARPRRRACRR